MTRQVLPLYGLIFLVAMLTFGIGLKVGRYYPHANAGFMSMFHHEPPVFDWFRRPV